MIRKLAFEQLHISEPTLAERRHAREECNEIIHMFQSFISIFCIVHLFFAGAAAAYILILCVNNDFTNWFSIFCRISLISDILFYVITFLIFVANFIFVAILYQLRSPRMLQKSLLILSAGLLLLSLFLTNFSLPMSYMINRSIDDYGDWYTSKLVDGGVSSLFQKNYKYLAVARMTLIIISSFIFPLFVSSYGYSIFKELYHSTEF
ncbi:hypothetical protein M9Y10_044910 [Tritrichomonas musculus]|uniref:Uncharacterized protein n=1 Tax=Tritrichomonas musculus TaxID=1915356 RepID=A0ABR2JUF7_9EUKA